VLFRSSLVPPYLRKRRTLAARVPWLYLKGIGTGGMSGVLSGLPGEQAGVPAVGRRAPRQGWQDELAAWKRRDQAGQLGACLGGRGVQRTAQRGREALLPDLGDRGMNAPGLAVGDGAMGFRSALDRVCPHTRHRRCRVCRTASVPKPGGADCAGTGSSPGSSRACHSGTVSRCSHNRKR